MFANLEQRAIRAAIGKLANATAQIGAATFRGRFGSPSAQVEFVGGTNPTLTCATADLPANPLGMSIAIAPDLPVGAGAVAYTIENHRMDGIGKSILDLSAA